IQTLLSQVFVWDISDPYTGTSTDLLLSEFQNTRFSFNGDLGQLVTFRDVGGGLAAGFNGLCNAGVNEKLSVNQLEPFYSTVPTYSLSVFISTHEFGHLFGSRHTHACVWNGNGTAIDGCAGFVEGSCGLPGNPAGGGTIMSYCANTSVGVNFSLGFGPQPGDVIRQRVTDATCLAICCRNNIVISGTYTKPITESGTWIASSGTTTIPASTTVRLDAQPGTGYVLLNPGFSTSASSVFSAQAYNGCAAGVPARTSGQTESPTMVAYKTVTGEQVEAHIQLYPNPATGMVTVKPVNNGEIVKRVSVIGASGNVLVQHNQPEQINTDRLTPGVYNCRVETNRGIYMLKLVKQ
ncbi:MAG: zinc-dependent metalloprotease, partial [Dinghuibacter sp.]|nr:zinc-dependent metalloprotease [Dinghuibacter sp.]